MKIAFASGSPNSGLLIILLGFGMVLTPGPCALNAAPGNDGRGLPNSPQHPPVRTYATVFNPASQKKVSSESPLWSISLKKFEPCSGCQSGESFTFDVRKKDTGVVSQFTIVNETAQVDEIHVVNSARVAIIGRALPNTSVVNVVELRSGKILDRFLCGWPSVSPDGRLVAYIKFFPSHMGYGYSMSDEYLVYDLSAMREDNRVGFNKGNPEDTTNVGLPIYPNGSLNTVNDNIISGVYSNVHTISSDGFFWLDGKDTVAFVDQWEGVNRLVVANIENGVQKRVVDVYPIKTLTLVDLPACEGKIAHSDLERWSKNPGAIVHITDILISPENSRNLRLYLSQQPCLTSTTLDIPLRTRPGPRVQGRDKRLDHEAEVPPILASE